MDLDSIKIIIEGTASQHDISFHQEKCIFCQETTQEKNFLVPQLGKSVYGRRTNLKLYCRKANEIDCRRKYFLLSCFQQMLQSIHTLKKTEKKSKRSVT